MLYILDMVTPRPATKLAPYQGALDAYRRQLIVDAARHVFQQSGLEGASIRAIAQAAGCTTGAIYPHFRSKEEIYAVVLGDSLASVANAEYGEPTMWRAIAITNELEDPFNLRVGQELLLPNVADAVTMA